MDTQRDPPFDLVILAASAGGLEAISATIRPLPADFAAAVVVAQHLGVPASSFVDILSRRTEMPVCWATAGMRLAPSRVHVCPPRHTLEVLPDRTCAVTPFDTARPTPIDDLLESAADSFGTRALAVILTGMGRDGAAGALALKQAGGTVIAQSEETAEHPSMPRAAVETGAAQLVLPLYDIGRMLAEVVAGWPLPRPRSEIDAAHALFGGSDGVSALLRDTDWSRTWLGPVRDWPVALRKALPLVLESPTPMVVLWGSQFVQVYNHHYGALMGDKHPAGLAQPNRACWPEAWHINEPIFRRVMQGEAVALRDALIPLARYRRLEHSWFDLGFSPVRDDDGNVGGILGTIFETTARVLAARRMRVLHTLGARAAGAMTMRESLDRALASLGDAAEDIPFAIGYLLDSAGRRLDLVSTVGLSSGDPLAPHSINVASSHAAWPVARVLNEPGQAVLVENVRERFGGVRGNGDIPTAALMVPLRLAGDQRHAGVLLLGLSPHLPFDAAYRGFLELIGAHVSGSLADARTRQRERERLERLAALDRTKTEFFSNISHEFRTPLTLLLAPLEEMLNARDALPPRLAAEVATAAANARRLLNLVDTLLDFSLAEAGRLRAHLEETDLAAFTSDIVAMFRSAAERSGLTLTFDRTELAEPVWVDHSMWDKIVSNLLSNALKFTLHGGITVSLRALAKHVELTVSDSGLGIPAEELPHVFKRFHRVRGTHGRTQEGAGIGLALVQDLVRQHRGRVRVQSEEGKGSTFTVWIPRDRRPVIDPAIADGTIPSTSVAIPVAEILAGKAAQWNSDAAPPSFGVDLEGPLGTPTQAALAHRAPGARILVAEDSADMRDYLQRLLSANWTVDTARDGIEALALLREREWDLLLADVMMPNLDGFGLLEYVRQDEQLRSMPVILVTARAGEEAAIEGLLAGADDYVAKPFSSRELIARVTAQIELSRMRRTNEAQLARELADTRILHDLGARLVAAGDSRTLHEEVLSAAIALTHADGGSFHLYDEKEQVLKALTTRGPGSICGAPYAAAWARVERTFAELDDGTAQSTPLLTRSGRLVGVLSTYWRERTHPPDRELRFLDLLARQAADLVERHQSEEALRESEQRLLDELARTKAV